MAFDCSMECVCRTDGGNGMCRSRTGGFCGTEDLLRDAVFIHWRRPRSSSPLAGHYRNASSTGAGVPFVCCWNKIIILFCIKYVLTFLNNVWFVWKTNNNSQQTPIQSCVHGRSVFIGGQHCFPPPNFLSTNKKLPPTMMYCKMSYSNINQYNIWILNI